MKLKVLQDERFSCHSCTNCCRDWHVELDAPEAERIEKLAWPEGDALVGAKALMRHAGKTYLAHRADGTCLFLNLETKRCRIHEQFGASAKPLGCRLFPFQVAPTFKGEASVIARYDCPTVRRNHGAPHAEEIPMLRRVASALKGADGFDDATCCYLDREQIQVVCEFIVTLLPGFADDARRALFMAYLCDWLAGLQVDELDRAVLGKAFATLKQEVDAACAAPMARPGMMHRMVFRTLLGMYLRRDEDVLNRRASRIGRAAALTRVVFGMGSLHLLGLAHPRGRLRKARLFRSPFRPIDPVEFALFWRMVRNRLESFQFMGQGNGGRGFLEGLRSLSLLYPLVVAAAKYSAASRGAAAADAADVDYAVGAIEHSFGRLDVLNHRSTRLFERLLLERSTFTRLVRSI